MTNEKILDILILGSGPAALCLASELAKQDLNIKGISTKSPNQKWENTYGIWASELEELGLESLLSHRWCKTVSFFGDGENKKGDTPTKHNYDYGLINQEAFQNELLKKCKGIEWLNETAKDIKEKNKLSEVICFSGLKIKARLVIDASGHKSNFVKRPFQNEIAQQAAYGIVGKFSSWKISFTLIPLLLSLLKSLFLSFSCDSAGKLANEVSSTKKVSLPKSIAYRKEGDNNCSSLLRWSGRKSIKTN